ncbi:NADH-quinone oxidoreductase subunit NuoE [Alkalibacter rhizosphaerae]|uniref:NADH-quinone oxidoreductase subunit NuoE n=1 Tax=Alkalibacter rhizosphaerae TaxID=2815577 RepID=A0A974XFE7_9FIRM|nr:NADH-quinone oxidoreductase subunit NuoE [Alkalibacter rhizosphaerae]QSX08862.1 NADH-quinone oxidoreductase subunit NuoE [Alkalibacter rhizosphaerae]
MENNLISKEMYDELEQFIDAIPNKKDAVIASLHKAQEICGYLPREVQEFIAEKLGVSATDVYGVVTFYSYFTQTPKGKYAINVCLGTACFVRGADKIVTELEKKLGIHVGETSEDGMFSLDGLRCVGACGLAPVVMVNGKVYGKIQPKDVKKILANYNE